MIFLDGPSGFAAVAARCTEAEKAMFCVAFWGLGAARKLGIEHRSRVGKKTEIVLNLVHGGSNPAEVKTLCEMKNVKVLQCDDLHAKIYALDDWVMLGSSNASANGLSYQNAEINGWVEANIADETGTLNKQLVHFYSNLQTRKIYKKDLAKAEVAWRSRRNSASVLAPEMGVIIRNPGRYTLVVYGTDKSPEADKLEKQIQAEFGKRVEVFEGWDNLPVTGDLICFSTNGKNFAYDGTWTRGGFESRRGFGTDVQPSHRTKDQPVIDEIAWQGIASWLWSKSNNGMGQFMPLDEAMIEYEASL